MLKTYAMIPARKGSERLKKKNYLELHGKNLIEICIEKALICFSKECIYLNTDDPELEIIAKKYDINFYLRERDLSSSTATSDQVVLDFFRKFHPDTLIWLNTVSPLQPIKDIIDFSRSFQSSNFTSGVTVNSHRAHAIMDGIPLNYRLGDGFSRTQDMQSIEILNYACMGWKKDALKDLENGILFPKEFFMFESSKLSSLFVKKLDDYDLVKKIYFKDEVQL